MPWLRTSMNACLALLTLLLSAMGGGRVAGERPGVDRDAEIAVAAPLAAPATASIPAPASTACPAAPATAHGRPAPAGPLGEPAVVPAPALLRGCAGGPRAP